MPLYSEGEWGYCRYGMDGGCLPPDWFQISYDSPETYVYSFTESAAGDVYAGTNPYGKIYKHTGTSWSLAYDSPESTIQAMILFNGDMYAGTGNNGLIYKSTDGSTWSLAYDSPVTNIWCFEEFNGVLYAGAQDGIIYKSSDGSTWSLAYDSPMEAIYCLQTFGQYIYAGGGTTNGVIYRSSDGSTWELAYDTPSTTIRSMALLGGDRPGGVPILLAGDGGTSQFMVYKSTDGLTWTISYSSATFFNGTPVLYGTDAMVYAGAGSLGVLLHTDNAVDWSLSYDSPAGSVNALYGTGMNETGFGDQTYGQCGWGGEMTCSSNLFVGTGIGGTIYTMDNFVTADIIPDTVQPDGGETITTDTYLIRWSINRSDYTNLVWDIEYTRDWSTNRTWHVAVDDTGGDPEHTGAPLTGIYVGQKVTSYGNYLEATWNVLPIVDSTDMKIRIMTRDTSSSCSCANSSWNESFDVFALNNGPC